MNIQQLLQVVSKALGRDFTPEVELFFRSRAAIGAALDSEGQAFFVANWRGIAEFMESADGKEAVELFMASWQESMKPKADAAGGAA